MLFVIWVDWGCGKADPSWSVCYGGTEAERVNWCRVVGFEGRDRKARAELLPRQQATAQ